MIRPQCVKLTLSLRNDAASRLNESREFIVGSGSQPLGGSESPGGAGWLKQAGPRFQSSCFSKSGLGPSFCTSENFQVGADGAVPEITLWGPLI